VNELVVKSWLALKLHLELVLLYEEKNLKKVKKKIQRQKQIERMIDDYNQAQNQVILHK
jgi:hypothetical protein